MLAKDCVGVGAWISASIMKSVGPSQRERRASSGLDVIDQDERLNSGHLVFFGDLQIQVPIQTSERPFFLMWKRDQKLRARARAQGVRFFRACERAHADKELWRKQAIDLRPRSNHLTQATRLLKRRKIFN